MIHINALLIFKERQLLGFGTIGKHFTTTLWTFGRDVFLVKGSDDLFSLFWTKFHAYKFKLLTILQIYRLIYETAIEREKKKH